MRSQALLNILCLLNFAVASSAQVSSSTAKLECKRVIDDPVRVEKIRTLARENRLTVFLRHAKAHQHIEREDCDDNPRGLNTPDGELQADKIGKMLHWLGVTDARVEASRACRTIQTAERLSLGAVNRSEELHEDSCRASINSRITAISCAKGNSVLVTHSGCMQVVLNTRVDLSAVEHNGILAFFSKVEPAVTIGCAWPGDWDLIEQKMNRGADASPNQIGRTDG